MKKEEYLCDCCGKKLSPIGGGTWDEGQRIPEYVISGMTGYIKVKTQGFLYIWGRIWSEKKKSIKFNSFGYELCCNCYQDIICEIENFISRMKKDKND